MYRKAEAGGRCQPACMACVCVVNTFILIVLRDHLHLGAGLDGMVMRTISGQRRVLSLNSKIQGYR